MASGESRPPPTSDSSCCIDAGNNAAISSNVLTDLDGNSRFVDDPATPDTGVGTPPIVDLGCYEYQPPSIILGDLNCDGALDLGDVAPLALALVDPVGYAAVYPACNLDRADLNAGGAADGQDIQAFVNALLGP